MMRRAALALALLFAVAACGSARVALLTASGDSPCFVASTTGMLIRNQEAGTAIVSEDMGKTTVPVRWPEGFTGRQSGDQVEVLDTAGRVVARTGQRYQLLGGYMDDSWMACTDGVYPPAWGPGQAP